MRATEKSDLPEVARKRANRAATAAAEPVGAKGRGQGECGAAKHGPDAEPGSRVTRAERSMANSIVQATLDRRMPDKMMSVLAMAIELCPDRPLLARQSPAAKMPFQTRIGQADRKCARGLCRTSLACGGLRFPVSAQRYRLRVPVGRRRCLGAADPTRLR